MALPTKKVTVLEEEIVITGLNCDQVEEMMGMGEQYSDAEGKPTFSKIDAEKRVQFAVTSALGGVTFETRWPKKNYLFTEWFNAFNGLHHEVLDLSGLRPATPGESLAVVEKASTSSDSAAA